MFKDDLKRYRQTYAKVFSAEVIDALDRLQDKGIVGEVGGVIKEGKEGAVCWGRGRRNEMVAIKIYKILTSRFHAMRENLLEDKRIRKVSVSRRKIVFQWAEREFRNLQFAGTFLDAVPEPLGVCKNVFVMSWIGGKGPAPLLINAEPEDTGSVANQIAEMLRKMKEHEFVHGDFSPYNLLYHEGRIVAIDFSHGSFRNTEQARERWDRDIKGMNGFFKKVYGFKENVLSFA